MSLVTQQTGQFSGYTLADLRSLTLKRLRVRNTLRYSPTETAGDYDWIDDAINRGQEEFVKRTLCLRTFAISELKASYRTYRLPWNFLDFMSAYYFDASLPNGYKELECTTVEKLNDDVAGWRTETGTPEAIYIDRLYGNNWMFGLYPIPDKDGDSITFNSQYGSVVEWVCPIFTFSQEYGVIIRMTDTDEFFLNTDTGVVGQVQTMNHNVYFEYYRLPEKLVTGTAFPANATRQYPEIPREYHLALPAYAAGDLLADNPEDSAEFKRSLLLKSEVEKQIQTYIGKRKKPLSAQNLQAKPLVWGWTKNMPFRSEMT